MCDGKNDCPLTETSSGGEDEEGCAEGSGQVGDKDDDGDYAEIMLMMMIVMAIMMRMRRTVLRKADG